MVRAPLSTPDARRSSLETATLEETDIRAWLELISANKRPRLSYISAMSDSEPYFSADEEGDGSETDGSETEDTVRTPLVHFKNVDEDKWRERCKCYDLMRRLSLDTSARRAFLDALIVNCEDAISVENLQVYSRLFTQWLTHNLQVELANKPLLRARSFDGVVLLRKEMVATKFLLLFTVMCRALLDDEYCTLVPDCVRRPDLGEEGGLPVLSQALEQMIVLRMGLSVVMGEVEELRAKVSGQEEFSRSQPEAYYDLDSKDEFGLISIFVNRLHKPGVR